MAHPHRRVGTRRAVACARAERRGCATRRARELVADHDLRGRGVRARARRRWSTTSLRDASRRDRRRVGVGGRGARLVRAPRAVPRVRRRRDAAAPAVAGARAPTPTTPARSGTRSGTPGSSLGQSVRTVKEALGLADDDLDALTALLDVRLVAGDRDARRRARAAGARARAAAARPAASTRSPAAAAARLRATRARSPRCSSPT